MLFFNTCLFIFMIEMETLIICGKAILYTLTLCVCAYTVTITYKEIVKELKKKWKRIITESYNKNTDNHGNHEVHTGNCTYCPSAENRVYIGYYNSCRNRKLIDETLQLAGDNQQLQRNILELYKTILDLKSEIIKLKDNRLVHLNHSFICV